MSQNQCVVTCENCGGGARDSLAVCPWCYAVLVENEDTYDPMLTERNPPDVVLVRTRSKLLVARLRKELSALFPNGYLSDTATEPARRHIREVVGADQEIMTSVERGMALHTVLDELFGFGPLGPFLRDPEVQYIFCTGTNPIYVERSGRLRKSNHAFENDEHLKSTIERLLIKVTEEVKASTLIEHKFPSGIHLTVILQPRVVHTTVTLRCLPHRSASILGGTNDFLPSRW